MHSFQSSEESPLSAARTAANRWLAQFAPLLQTDELTTASECDRALDVVKTLRASGRPTLAEINRVGELADQSLISTLQQAVGQLDSVEESIRRRLALVQPGDPDGIVDIAKLQSELAIRAARTEMNVTDEDDLAVPLDLPLVGPNYPAALASGIFALGWNSFVLFHMVMMIGGLMHAIGFAAFFLLLFYSIFIFAGLAISKAAIDAAASHSARLDGLHLTISHRLAGITWSRERDLEPGARAFLGFPNAPAGDEDSPRFSRRSVNVQEMIGLTDIGGKTVWLPAPTDPNAKAKLVQRINLYLTGQRAI